MHMHRISKIAITFKALLLLSVAPMSAHAQESVEDAVRATIQRHPSVEAAKKAFDTSVEKKRELYSDFFPEISVGGAGGRIYGDNSTTRGLTVSRGAAYSNYGEGSISMNQKIFDGMETLRRNSAANNRQKSAQINITDIQEALALRAAQAYVNVVRARIVLAMIDEHARLVRGYVGRIENMVFEGATDETEYQQAHDIEVVLEGIRADYQGQVMAAEARYAEATGAYPQSQMSLPPVMLQYLPDNLNEAVRIAMSEHPSIISAKLDAAAASDDMRAEKSTLYPDVNGELSYLKSDKKDIIGGEIEDAKALMRVSWNFSTGGRQLARIEQTKHTMDETVSRVHEVERQVEQDVRLSYVEVATSIKQLRLLKERQELNERLFETYQSQFEGAVISLFQLMRSHNQLFNTRLEVINGKYRYIGAQYAALASIGKLHTTLLRDEEPVMSGKDGIVYSAE